MLRWKKAGESLAVILNEEEKYQRKINLDIYLHVGVDWDNIP